MAEFPKPDDRVLAEKVANMVADNVERMISAGPARGVLAAMAYLATLQVFGCTCQLTSSVPEPRTLDPAAQKDCPLHRERAEEAA